MVEKWVPRVGDRVKRSAEAVKCGIDEAGALALSVIAERVAAEARRVERVSAGLVGFALAFGAQLILADASKLRAGSLVLVEGLGEGQLLSKTRRWARVRFMPSGITQRVPLSMCRPHVVPSWLEGDRVTYPGAGSGTVQAPSTAGPTYVLVVFDAGDSRWLPASLLSREVRS